MAKAPVAIKTASVLAFERKLATSDAVMYAGNWQGNEWQPIEIQEKAVRGTISNRLKNAIVSDPTKLDAEIQKANLQRVDVASLPVDTDTLKVVFTLRVLGNLSTPSVCNDMAYQEALSGVIEGYISEHGFKELALRYALNLANGRFLWRNRIGAEQIQVKVTANETSWTFNSHDFSLRQFDQGQAAVTQLAAIIEQGLSAKEWVMLTVEAQVRLGAGQEVFPSQELVLDSNSSKSRVLYQVAGIAGIHSQKIGNALRTIDTWYPKVDELGAIAVEPYGSVTSRGVACRQPKEKLDFYTLLDNWVTKGMKPDVKQQHYVMAVSLVRNRNKELPMDHYLEIRVLPDPEFSSEMLMAALFAKLHRVLGARGQGDIGVSFPDVNVMPGARLRLHGSAQALQALEASTWRKGLTDYCQCSPVTPVPEIKGWRVVSRVQVKSNSQRLLRRSVKKGWLTEEQAIERLATQAEQRTDLPFLNMKSLSSQQLFKLFIRHGDLLKEPVKGEFSSYGLSATATIPWF